MLAGKNLSLGEPLLLDDSLYWLETRPAEKGRSLIVQYRQGQYRDLIPAPYSVRSGVHEYGGAAWTTGSGKLFFVNAADQAIWSINLDQPDSAPQKQFDRNRCRYADLQWLNCRNALIAVEEDHSQTGEPANRLVLLTLESSVTGTTRTILAEGADFYAGARFNELTSELVWLQWNHPSMPWYGCELWLAKLGKSNRLETQQKLAGGEQESIFQPGWHMGQIYYCSDRSNFWQIYRHDPELGEQPVSQFDGECGLPLWQFGMHTWTSFGDKLLCAVSREASWSLIELDPRTGERGSVNLPCSLVQGFSAEPGRFAAIVSTETQPPTLLLHEEDSTRVVRSSMDQALDPDDISKPLALKIGSGETACHTFFYPPKNRRYCGADDELPPLVVICHGGPTAATAPALNLKVQFWTTRGFAVADINYRGSTGYGRAYREQLDGQWGVADVEDACNTASYLAESGRVDGKKLLIRGSSAGGLTVLSALCFHSVFAAGASIYGIGDLKVLASETHKFEARYGDRLIAPWPEEQAVYRQRSPLTHIEGFNCPVIFFQGLQDKVVPPNQAEMMFDALRKKGIPTAMRTYPAEGHGFRSEQAIVDSFNAELAFYGKVLGFETDSAVQDLDMANHP